MRANGLLLMLFVLCASESRGQAIGAQREMAAAAALRPATASLSLTEPWRSDFAAAARFRSRAPGATLMIIGAAATVAGILVGGSGGTLLIVGGIGIGAYGLYLYTR